MRLDGTLSAPAGAWNADLAWKSFPDHPTEPGTPPPGQWSFVGNVSPLTASSRKASTTWILFEISLPKAASTWALTPGKYELILKMTFVGAVSKIRWLSRPAIEKQFVGWRGYLSLTADELAFLQSSCVPTDGELPNYLTLNVLI